MAASYRRKARGLADVPPHYAHASPSLLAETPNEIPEAKPDRAQEKEWEAIFTHCESRFQALYTWRVSVWTTWLQIARYEKPERFYAFITDNTYNQGLREDFAIVDRTASQAGEDCAAGLMMTLTDPEQDWLVLGPAIPNFELDRQGRNYYQDLTERLNYIYDNSNFYEAQAQAYEDETFFGNGVTIDYEDEKRILNVMTSCAGEYLLGTGFDNGDEVLYREFRQTVSATVEQFGLENCPEDIRRMWAHKGGALQHENVIRHAIEPNFPILGASGVETGVVPGGFTWRETFWVGGRKNTAPLSMTGFHEAPHACARWATQGNEAYGRGIGERMLGDTIQLQLETRQKAESIEKVNRPPMGADVSLQNLPSATSPGKITYFNTGANGEKKFFPLYEVKPDIAAITADIQIIQARIQSTAFKDVFQRLMALRQQLNMKTQLTATEVEQLTEEALARLGPMIFRNYTTMRQRVRRHLAIMGRKGLMPRKPHSLQGVPLNIGFRSLLTRAREAVKTQSIARTTQFAGSIAGEWPEVRFKINAMEAVDKFAEGVGCPADVIRSDDEAKALMNQANREKQMAEAMAQTAVGAKAAQSLSQTSLAPGSALAALVQPQQ